MSGRLVCLGAVIALLVGLASAQLSACYDLPMPDCGFECGPEDACPDGYTCADDHRCHRDGAPDDLVCDPPDDASSNRAARTLHAPTPRS